MSLHQLVANALWKFGKRPVWLSIFPSSLQLCCVKSQTRRSGVMLEIQLVLFLLPCFVLLWGRSTQPCVLLGMWLFPRSSSLQFFWGDNVATIPFWHTCGARPNCSGCNRKHKHLLPLNFVKRPECWAMLRCLCGSSVQGENWRFSSKQLLVMCLGDF